MNCKPGDLAIVVKSFAGNEGKIVRCIRLRGEKPCTMPGRAATPVLSWEIDRPLVGWDGSIGETIPDWQLRPLRGDVGSDERIDELVTPNVK